MDDDCTTFASRMTPVTRESIREAWAWLKAWDASEQAFGRNILEALRVAVAQTHPAESRQSRQSSQSVGSSGRDSPSSATDGAAAARSSATSGKTAAAAPFRHGVYLVTAGPAEQRCESVLEYTTAAVADGHTQIHTVAYNSHDQPVVRRLLEPLASATHGRYHFVLDERSPREVGKSDPAVSWSFDVHSVEARAQQDLGKDLWEKAASATGVRSDAAPTGRTASGPGAGTGPGAVPSEQERKYLILATWMQSRTRTTMQRLLAEDLVANAGDTLMHREAAVNSKHMSTETLCSGEDMELLFSEVGRGAGKRKAGLSKKREERARLVGVKERDEHCECGGWGFRRVAPGSSHK